MTERSNITFILEKVKEIIRNQQNKVIEYIDTSMNEEQIDLHKNNLLINLINPELLEAMIKIELISDGRNIE